MKHRRSIPPTVCLLLSLVVLIAGRPPQAGAQATGVFRELFTDFNRANSPLWQLTNDFRFINGLPTSTNIFTSFSTEQGLGDDYGQRVRGFLTAPTTGSYTFWISSDEVGQLLLSTNENPANKRLIAICDPRAQPGNYTTHAAQQSSIISLQAGQRYYIEALHGEAGLIDHLSVQWRLPNNAVESPIPGTRLQYEIAPLLTVALTNVTVEEGRAAVFATETANFLPQSYRWQRSGVDLVGASGQSYTLPSSALTDDGALFRAFITNRVGATNTAEVSLTVLRDTNAPIVASVLNVSRTNLLVMFSEPVAAPWALDTLNYAIAGVTMQGAAFGDDARTVMLTVSPLAFQASYALSISGVRDLASQPNTLGATQVVFTAREFNPLVIGSPTLPGSITLVAGGADVAGSGENNSERSDQFQFGYQVLSGNFDLKVRVQGLDFTDLWARAGFMARESLLANSRFAAAFATPTLAGSFFQYRAMTDGLAAKAGSFPVSFPDTWLRLQRTGNLFSGYASMDGANWTQLGSVTIAMSNRVYFGYAVTSQHTNQLTTAQFRDFSPVATGTVNTVTPTREALGASSRRTGLVISEIMYHPRDVFLGTNKAELEFVELFNSNPFFEDISGYRLAGDIDYTFPPGTVIQGGSFLVVARVPADVQIVHGISGVLGPFTNNLPNDAGRVRLRNDSGTVLLEVNYSAKFPWPVAADGAGHSLVLARPSYGENQREAWAASDAIGGSPGRLEPFGADRLRPVVINEYLAHSDAPSLDFIELYNPSSQEVDVGGAFLTDNPATNKFRVPSPTIIPPRGFVSFDQNQLGFSLSSAGERILLVNSNQTRVIDAIGFDAQANGVSSGRSPDGAPTIVELAMASPGTSNTPPLSRDVVINEIMYHPISENSDDEFVELHNKGMNAVNVGGWRFTDGISFTFPSNTFIPAGGFLVVAANRTNLFAHYANLNSGNTVGDFSGSLRNSGERLALAMPQLAVNADNPLNVTTNTIHVVVDEVEYRNGGRWGQWSDGGGSSLELLDPRSDNRLAPNWADSDESTKAPWTTLETTGVLDNGGDAPSALHVMLLEEGECLLDNVEVFVAPAGANLITNPTFEANANGWLIRGNHQRSSPETNEGFNSSRSLHIRATSRGDIGANKILFNFSGLSANQTATIRAKVRWLRGWPELLLRLRGSYLEATDRMIVPLNLGTPGAPNSRLVANAGPAIVDVAHTPPVPAANQPVVVAARVSDPDGVASVAVKYRLDPSTNFITAAMNDAGADGDAFAGDGVYGATIPGQAADTVVAFAVEATDGGTGPATTRFPALRADNGVVRECLVHFGSAVPASGFGSYRFWITQASITNWAGREVLSNERIDGTFVYGNQRVIYNAGARYSGSPAHQDQAAPDYSPVGTPNNYALDMPKDDLLLGTDNFNKIHGSGNNHHDDNTLVRETTAYWMARRLGLPENYKRHVMMFINGARRGTLMEDTQVPNGDGVEALFPEDSEGDLYKLSIWYEFGVASPPQVLPNTGLSECNLNNYTTTGGVKKRARYRWNWQGRATHGTANDYTNVFGLIDAANTPVSGPFAQNLEAVADMEQWMQTFALEHAVGNWDSFGYRNEQNMFAYKPERDRWKLLIWDINIIFGGGTRGTPVAVTDDLFEIDTANVPMRNITNTPAFRRAYYRALRDIVDGPFINANADPLMDARFAAFEASGVHVTPPDMIKTWIALRRAYIQAQLAAADTAAFAINTPANFTSSSNFVAISGTAAFALKTIEVNGIARLVTWTSLSNWVVRLPVDQATNQFTIAGYDHHGLPVPGAIGQVTVLYTGPVAPPEDSLVINEIMYHPLVPESSFIEILNTSTNFAFDLSNWRLNGADFVFSEGTVITNGQFLLVVKNRGVFSQVYGSSNFVAGEYEGRLDDGGETLSLERPVSLVTTNGAIVETNLVFAAVDQVRYDDELPWTTAADGTGPSLQLVDHARDNSRVSNWRAGNAWVNVTRTGNIGTATNLMLWLSAAGSAFVDDITLIGPGGTNIAANGGFESDSVMPWLLSTNLAGSDITNGVSRSGTRSLFLSATAPGGNLNNSIQQWIGAAVETNTSYTLSYWILFHTNPATVNMRTLPGSGFVSGGVAVVANATPGATNQFVEPLPAYDPLWLNEVQSDNADGITDNFGEREPWIELYNAGTNTLNLDGYFLANQYTSNLTQWPFPATSSIAPGEFKLIWTDGEPGQTTGANLHTSFRLNSTTGTVALVRLVNSQPQITDYLTYANLRANLSYGALPDGQPFHRQVLNFVTPRTNNVAPPVAVFLNEWLAGNTNTLADPADLDFEDWFELYNAGTATVDLAGYYLTDALSNPTKFKIPDGYTIAPGGFLLVWADEETDQNSSNRVDLHVNFRLASGGEEIGLYSPSGGIVDQVTFAGQTNDVSQGRFADGAAAIHFMTTPTPRGPNVLSGSGNTAPQLAAISNRTVTLGQTLSFTASASDAEVPPQSLNFSLEGNVPLGAGINAGSGLFTWTPGASQTPGTNVLTVRVTDTGAPPLSATRTFTVFVVGPPRISGITPPMGGVVSLTLQTNPGKTYRLEYKNSLSDAAWLPLGPDRLAGSSSLTIDDNIGANPQRFYRIVILD